jgi:hypothetical protein
MEGVGPLHTNAARRSLYSLKGVIHKRHFKGYVTCRLMFKNSASVRFLNGMLKCTFEFCRFVAVAVIGKVNEWEERRRREA